METVVRVSALAAIVVLLVGLLLQAVASQFQPVGPDGLARGFKNRGLAMELARSTSEVERILGKTNSWNREVMRQLQVFDFAFIACYWLLFTLIAILLAQCRFSLAWPLAIGATICAGAAAVCDVWEDVFILKVTRVLDLDAAQGLIDKCRHAAQWKWSLLFVAMLLLSSLFWHRADWRSLFGFVCGIAGLLLVATGAYGLISLPSDGYFEGAAKLMGLALLVLTIVLGWSAFQPVRLLPGL